MKVSVVITLSSQAPEIVYKCRFMNLNTILIEQEDYSRQCPKQPKQWASYVAHVVFLHGLIVLAHIAPASIFGNWHGVRVMWVNDGYTTEYPLIAHMGSMCLIDVGTICPRSGLDMAYRCGLNMGDQWVFSGMPPFAQLAPIPCQFPKNCVGMASYYPVELGR